MSQLTTSMEIGLYPKPTAWFRVFDTGVLITEYTLNSDYSVTLSSLAAPLNLDAADYQEEVFNLGRWRRAIVTTYEMSPWPGICRASGQGTQELRLRWRVDQVDAIRARYDGRGTVRIQPRPEVTLSWPLFNTWVDLHKSFACSIAETVI